MRPINNLYFLELSSDIYSIYLFIYLLFFYFTFPVMYLCCCYLLWKALWSTSVVFEHAI